MNTNTIDYRITKKALLCMAEGFRTKIAQLVKNNAEDICCCLRELPMEQIFMGDWQRGFSETVTECLTYIYAKNAKKREKLKIEIKECCLSILHEKLKMPIREIEKEIPKSFLINASSENLNSYLMPLIMFLSYNFYNDMDTLTAEERDSKQQCITAFAQSPDRAEEWGDFVGDGWFGIKYGEFFSNPIVKKNRERFKTRLMDYFMQKTLTANPELKNNDDYIPSTILINHTVSNCYRGLECVNSDSIHVDQIVGNAQNAGKSYSVISMEFVRNELSRYGVVLEPDIGNKTKAMIEEQIDQFCDAAIINLYRHLSSELLASKSLKNIQSVKYNGIMNVETSLETIKEQLDNMKLNPNEANKIIRNMDMEPYAVNLLWSIGLFLVKKHSVDTFREDYIQAIYKDNEKEITDDRITELEGELLRSANNYNAKVQELKKQKSENERLVSKIRKLEQQLSESKQQKNPDDTEKKSLYKKIEKQSGQISEMEIQLRESREMQDILREKMNYIKSMKNGSKESELDLNAKYIFVSSHIKTNQKLKEWFPNSENYAEYKISENNIDTIVAVICITQEARHSQYYKAKSICEKKNIPFINCNCVNFGKICESISEGLA